MVEIRLDRARWHFDSRHPLGPPGGFGTVFSGKAEDGTPVAVKQLKVEAEEAGHRELAIADVLVGREFGHVVPVLDAGLDPQSGRYFVVMAKAGCSLLDRLGDASFSEDEAVGILRDIVSGLLEVADIVHRDLKPGNVLRHAGAWKIADFGIARFVEESTSSRTLKGCRTPEYAAPEQWRGERSTHATDVYALGCLAFHLLSGHPPFQGNDLQHSHLQEQPPRPPASPRLEQLVLQCLRKNPDARPALEAIRSQLEDLASEPVRLTSLAEAGAAVAVEQAAHEAQLQRLRTAEERREELARDGLASLDLLVDQLFEAIEADASVAKRSAGGKSISLGHGELRVTVVFPYLAAGDFAEWKKDVVCGALIRVSQKADAYPGRSANLWYLDLDGSYRWWEYAYWRPWMAGGGYEDEPFGVVDSEGLEDADFAGSPVAHSVNIANRPTLVDGEETPAFVARWADRLAEAASNSLQRPSSLPEG